MYQIDTIIIVDNNATFKIKSIIAKINVRSKIFVIKNKRNEGTAKGIKQAFKYFERKTKCDFVWILDHDNIPSVNALSNLMKEYQINNKKEINSKTILVSNRVNRSKYQKIIKNWQKGFVKKTIVEYKNSFMYFNISKLTNKILRKNTFNKKKENVSVGLVPLKIAPYGGLLLSRNAIKTVGYPLQQFFLYNDDYEYTYRLSQKGYKIYILINSKITEEISYNNEFYKTPWQMIIFSPVTVPPFRMYYSIRNMIVFERLHLCNNKFLWTINMIIFISIMVFICIINLRIRRMMFLLKTMFDGIKFNLKLLENDIY